MRLALLLLLAACAARPPADDTAVTDDTAPTGDTAPDDTAQDTDTAAPLSYARDVFRPLLEESCADCHLEAGYIHPPITADPSHLVGQPSNGGGMPYVTPGSLEESLLWFKVTGRQDEVPGHRGERMPPPPDEEPLSAEAIATIEAWILDGAHD